MKTQEEFKGTLAGRIDRMLNLVYVLLFMALTIALFGIANTLALSVFERTREIGLLRAVGMSRKQLRQSVRWESVLIALLGTTLGAAIGLGFAWALVESMKDKGIDTLTIPTHAAGRGRRGGGGRVGGRGGAARPPGITHQRAHRNQQPVILLRNTRSFAAAVLLEPPPLLGAELLIRRCLRQIASRRLAEGESPTLGMRGSRRSASARTCIMRQTGASCRQSRRPTWMRSELDGGFSR